MVASILGHPSMADEDQLVVKFKIVFTHSFKLVMF